MTYQHQFGFGDALGVREVLFTVYPELRFQVSSPESTGYPAHGGSPSLIDAVRGYLTSLYGVCPYQHILITAGCSHAIQAAIHAVRNDLTTSVITRSLYFPFYPNMIKTAGLKHAVKQGLIYNDIALYDDLSPVGIRENNWSSLFDIRILDAAYLSRTYGLEKLDLMTSVQASKYTIVGSLGKMTGLNGLRVGFLGTNDHAVYQKAYDYVTYTTIGANIEAQTTIAKILSDLDRFDLFLDRSKGVLDSNRIELSRLRHLFGQDIPSKGMFALLAADSKLKDLFEKASVVVTDGMGCGADCPSIRINLSNSNGATKRMVDAVIKADLK